MPRREIALIVLPGLLIRRAIGRLIPCRALESGLLLARWVARRQEPLSGLPLAVAPVLPPGLPLAPLRVVLEEQLRVERCSIAGTVRAIIRPTPPACRRVATSSDKTLLA